MRRAVVTGTGVDLFLQSVVTLPQRKVRLYEAQPRVREPDGGFSDGDVVADAAWRLGVIANHDAGILKQVVKVVRHLAARERDVPVICPVSLSSLAERSYFELLSDALSEGPAIAGRLVLRVRADQMDSATPAQADALDAVRAIGARLLLDGVRDLRVDPHGLARRGIRYVKIAAPLLLAGAEGGAPSEIHPADLSGFLTRQGVALIVCDVATEDMALELMDYGAALGQGDAFAGPRPVRQEVFVQDPPAQAGAGAPAPPVPTAAPAAQPADEQPQRASLRSFLRRTTA